MTSKPRHPFKAFVAPALLPSLSSLPSLFSADNKNKVGGQALIEGVMMRGPEKVSWAVRKPDGEAVIEVFPFVSVTKRVKIWGIPVVRGVINLFESLSWGYKALSRSADIAMDEGPKESASGDGVDGSVNEKAVSADAGTTSANDKKAPVNTKVSSTDKKKSIGDQLFMAANFIIALVISMGLFMYAPMWVANRLPYIKDSPMLFNLTAGAVRIVLFLAYLLLISLWSEMRRVFEYHGAEHKAIFAYEDGKELTPGNVDSYPTVHPRCGTSFLILVAICSILLFTVIDALYIQYLAEFVNHKLALAPKEALDASGKANPYPLFHRFIVHLILIPLVAGTSYEALKLSDKYQRLPLVGYLIMPGLWLQKITTRKPDAPQIEVAIKALEAAL